MLETFKLGSSRDRSTYQQLRCRPLSGLKISSERRKETEETARMVAGPVGAATSTGAYPRRNAMAIHRSLKLAKVYLCLVLLAIPGGFTGIQAQTPA